MWFILHQSIVIDFLWYKWWSYLQETQPYLLYNSKPRYFIRRVTKVAMLLLLLFLQSHIHILIRNRRSIMHVWCIFDMPPSVVWSSGCSGVPQSSPLATLLPGWYENVRMLLSCIITVQIIIVKVIFHRSARIIFRTTSTRSTHNVLFWIMAFRNRIWFRFHIMVFRLNKQSEVKACLHES